MAQPETGPSTSSGPLGAEAGLWAGRESRGFRLPASGLEVESMIKMETWILGGLLTQKKSLKKKQSAWSTKIVTITEESWLKCKYNYGVLSDIQDLQRTSQTQHPNNR
ncbi:small integral membrane protein 15 isoform X2 [Lontra canadensis]|uniref:small integral membrane protein 15 isoform X2 n=1 Tax=Lontra canadensis TaxID=76717 RepID=UPI0013F2D476|nr:small integral membrane protein 15 isoform X2 [Lontra canadensis]